MSAFDVNLRAVEQLHHRLVEDLQRAVTVLALAPGYATAIDAGEPEYETLRAHRREMVRLAKLYADPALIEGVAYESVIERLSEGLIE